MSINKIGVFGLLTFTVIASLLIVPAFSSSPFSMKDKIKKNIDKEKIEEKLNYKSFLNIEYDKKKDVDPNLLSLDIYTPEKIDENKKLPVVIMVHGGGWKNGDKANKDIVIPKAYYFTNQNAIYVTLNYRLAPEAGFPDYPIDVAKGINWAYDNIEQYGGDKDKMFVMGHSAGAHLAALVSLDERYMLETDEEKISIENKIKGVILLDGAGYNIPEVMKNASPIQKNIYVNAFGRDPETWEKASPINYVESENNKIPFLVFYLADREDTTLISTELTDKLTLNGHKAINYPVKDKTHSGINIEFGYPNDEVSKATTEFITQILTENK